MDTSFPGKCICAMMDDGSCDFCQAYYFGEIDLNGNLTEYGKTLIVGETDGKGDEVCGS